MVTLKSENIFIRGKDKSKYLTHNSQITFVTCTAIIWFSTGFILCLNWLYLQTLDVTHIFVINKGRKDYQNIPIHPKCVQITLFKNIKVQVKVRLLITKIGGQCGSNGSGTPDCLSSPVQPILSTTQVQNIVTNIDSLDLHPVGTL